MNTVRYMKLRIGLNCHPTGGFVCGCNASDRGYNLIDSHENPAYLATGAANFRAGMGLRGPQAASLKDDDLIPRWSNATLINVVVVGGQTNPYYQAANMSYSRSISIDKWT